MCTLVSVHLRVDFARSTFFSPSEIRNHGVGYYQFSTSEEERKEQMKTLDKLREQVNRCCIRAALIIAWFMCAGACVRAHVCVSVRVRVRVREPTCACA